MSQFMGSLNWASGLIPLGRLHMRCLQRHFYSLGLTNQFTPPCPSDPLVLATLLRQWQNLWFLTSGIPIRPFQMEFTIFTDASTQGGGAHRGDFQISGVWTHSERRLHINVLDAQGRQYHCCSLYQQTRWGPFLRPVAAGSGSISMVTDSRYSHPGQTYPGLPQYIRVVGNSCSGHVCHHPQHASSPVYVTSYGATSTGLVGEVDVHFSTVPPAQQSRSEAQDHLGGQGDSHSPWWPSQPWFPHLVQAKTISDMIMSMELQRPIE